MEGVERGKNTEGKLGVCRWMWERRGAWRSARAECKGRSEEKEEADK